MSQVTGLAQLLGQLLWSVHFGNFSLVDRDQIFLHLNVFSCPFRRFPTPTNCPWVFEDGLTRII